MLTFTGRIVIAYFVEPYLVFKTFSNCSALIEMTRDSWIRAQMKLLALFRFSVLIIFSKIKSQIIVIISLATITFYLFENYYISCRAALLL